MAELNRIYPSKFKTDKEKCDAALKFMDILLCFSIPEFESFQLDNVIRESSLTREYKKDALEVLSEIKELLKDTFGYSELDKVFGYRHILTEKGRRARKAGGHFAYIQQIKEKEKSTSLLSNGYSDINSSIKKKVFISFCESDRSRMVILKRAVENSKSLTPIIVEEKREDSQYLSDLVSKDISGSDYFIPILTTNSICTQWVNQEIGFAYADSRFNILPIVEKNIINSLKGFIHNQMQLNYTFESDIKDQNKKFTRCCKSLIDTLDRKHLIINIDELAYSKFVETIKEGKLFISGQETWIIIGDNRHLITDDKTLERVSQLIINKAKKNITLEDLKKIKQGQNLKSKGPLHYHPPVYGKNISKNSY